MWKFLKSTAVCVALIPPFFLDCVVAIGVPKIDPESRQTVKQWVASGFLYGQFMRELSPTTSEYRTFLVTNRHVLQYTAKIYVRFNPEEGNPAREYEFDTRKPDGSPRWFALPEPTADVAVIPIGVDSLRADGVKVSFFQSNTHVMDRVKARQIGLTEGDGIFALGFPLGQVGEQRNYVIVRQGSIARIRDALAGASNEFLIDAFVFPGNSGGPVITKPEIIAIQGTQSQGASYLIGLVRGFIPYQERALSEQTGRPRVVFEENSGLTAVIPIDLVRDTIEAYMMSLQDSKP